MTTKTTKAPREEITERDCDELVRREVMCCVSGIVSVLAGGYGFVTSQAKRHGLVDGGNELAALCEQAMELAAPVDDWEEAAIQAGWRDSGTVEFSHAETGRVEIGDNWRELCESEGIEPYQREVFEHWAVSFWLADALEAEGEKVDRDFQGLNVWARTTTG
jgi:hypothetical protein